MIFLPNLGAKYVQQVLETNYKCKLGTKSQLFGWGVYVALVVYH